MHNEKQSKTVLLNDTDPLWARLRSMHIADLGTLLHTEFKQFLADNPDVMMQMTERVRQKAMGVETVDAAEAGFSPADEKPIDLE